MSNSKNKLECYAHNIRFENPFLCGSGPPSTNGKVIARSFEAGWGGSVIKTLSLDHTKVKNIAPRYGHFKDEDGKCIGFTNNELITDRPLDIWLEEIKELKKKYPDKVLIASIMEEPNKDNWQELTDKVTKAGVDLIELNFSCPHGMPERQMGLAMGNCPDIVGDVTGWVKEATDLPVWAKMTPNITDIREPARAAINAKADGLVAINTILSVAGIDLKTFKPIPNVKGVSAFGGYSYKAVKPIGLRMVGELAMEFPQTEISGVGGIYNAQSSAEYLCMGASTLQVCTAIMLDGFKIIDQLKSGLIQILDDHGMESVHDMKRKSLEYFGTMAEMARRMEEAKSKKVAHTDHFGEAGIVAASKDLTGD
jgi:dihydroorotate dehydrogenase subfamily 1